MTPTFDGFIVPEPVELTRLTVPVNHRAHQPATTTQTHKLCTPLDHKHHASQ